MNERRRENYGKHGFCHHKSPSESAEGMHRGGLGFRGSGCVEPARPGKFLHRRVQRAVAGLYRQEAAPPGSGLRIRYPGGTDIRGLLRVHSRPVRNVPHDEIHAEMEPAGLVPGYKRRPALHVRVVYHEDAFPALSGKVCRERKKRRHAVRLRGLHASIRV